MLKKSSSLKAAMIIVMVVLILIQAVIFLSLSNFMNTFAILDSNTANCARASIENRSNIIESTMLNKWSDINSNTESIEEIIDRRNSVPEVLPEEDGEKNIPTEKPKTCMETLRGNPTQINYLLGSCSEELKEMINNNDVTGAFIILNTNFGTSASARPALYIRKSDSETDGYSAVYGFPTGVKDLNKSDVWQKELILNESNNEEISQNFFYMPALYQKKSAGYDADDFGYWSKPFRLFDGDEKIITYSVPLVSQTTGEFYGVAGIEISESKIKSLMPVNTIYSGSNDSYAISQTNTNSTDYFSNSVISGSLAEMISGINNSATYFKEDTTMGKDAYHILISDNGIDAYAFTRTLNLYGSTSYFRENESWSFIGIVSGSYITHVSTTVRSTIHMTLEVSVLIVALVTVLFVGNYTAPVKRLLASVRKLDFRTTTSLERTKITEFDELAAQIEICNNNLVKFSSKVSKYIDLANTPLAIFDIPNNSDKVFVSKSIVNILSVNPAVVVDSYIDKKDWEYIYDNLTKKENVSYEGSYHISNELGGEKWIKVNTFESEDGKIGVLTDITENVLERKRIEYERDYDSLTGIINRRAFFDRADEILPKCKTAAVTLWNIENLKFINGKYGHATGDKLIKAATLVLDSASDSSNTVTARLSGDEFVTIFFGSENREYYINKINDLFNMLTQVVLTTPDDIEIRIEATAGVAIYPDDADSVKSLLKCSDYAIMRDKDKHKNQHENYIAEYFYNINL